MTRVPRRSRRVLIAAGCLADARAALRLTTYFTDSETGEIGGVLVEETLVSEVAVLPNQQVVTTGGAMVIAPTPSQLHRIAESEARAFRQALSEAAKGRKWTFERQRGDLISGIFDAARDWDLLVLGYHEIGKLKGGVVLIAPAKAAAPEASHLAEVIAKRVGTRTLTLTLDADQAAQGSPSADTRSFPSERELLSYVGRIRASAVVLDISAGPLRTPDQLRRLVEVARCPLVLLGVPSQGSQADRQETGPGT